MWAAGTAILSLAGACTTMAEGGASEPAVDEIPILTSMVGVEYPLDRYQMTDELLDLALRATGLLVTDCMAGFGLDWQLQQSAGNSDASDRRARRYGLLDLSTATELGYHLPAPGGAEQAGGDEAWEMTPEHDLVWLGNGASTYNGMPIPEGGCAGEAQRRLEDGAPEPPRFLVVQLEHQAGQRTDADSRVQDVWSRWSGCMRDKGLDYDDPWQASNDLRWQAVEATEPEIATAVADVECKREVNLAGVWYAVEVACQEQLIEENFPALALVAEYIDMYTANVAAVLDGE